MSEELQHMSLMDKIKLQEYFENHSPDKKYLYPYLYDELTQQILFDLTNLENQIIERYKKGEEQKEEKRRQIFIKECSVKYPKKYLIYEGSDYLVIKEDEEGQTITEWAINNYGYPSMTKINEVYYYENYVKLNGKIWYGSRYITIGKEPYDKWKKTFGHKE